MGKLYPKPFTVPYFSVRLSALRYGLPSCMPWVLNLLGGRERPPPRYIWNQLKMAACTGKRSILTILQKNSWLVNSLAFPLKTMKQNSLMNGFKIMQRFLLIVSLGSYSAGKRPRTADLSLRSRRTIRNLGGKKLPLAPRVRPTGIYLPNKV